MQLSQRQKCQCFEIEIPVSWYSVDCFLLLIWVSVGKRVSEACSMMMVDDDDDVYPIIYKRFLLLHSFWFLWHRTRDFHFPRKAANEFALWEQDSISAFLTHRLRTHSIHNELLSDWQLTASIKNKLLHVNFMMFCFCCNKLNTMDDNKTTLCSILRQLRVLSAFCVHSLIVS